MNSASTKTITYSVWMLSALGEPPDSGNRSPAWAAGAATRGVASAAGSANLRPRRRRRSGTRAGSIRSPTARSRRGCQSRPREARRALLHERRHALDEVGRASEFGLDARLQLELFMHARELPLVELALRARVGPRGAAGQALGQRSGFRFELVVFGHAVDQAPFQGFLRRDALAQHRHLGRSREPDPLGDEKTRTPVRDQTDVDE